jgi:hypothetical protein
MSDRWRTTEDDVSRDLARLVKVLTRKKTRTVRAPSETSPASSIDMEAVQDMIATFLVAGANISLTYNDAANTLTIAVTGITGYPGDEAVQDMIAGFLVAGSGVTLTYNDSANTLTITVSGTYRQPVAASGQAVFGNDGDFVFVLRTLE